MDDAYLDEILLRLNRVRNNSNEKFVCGVFYSAKQLRGGGWDLQSFSFSSPTQGRIEDDWNRPIPTQIFPKSGFKQRKLKKIKKKKTIRKKKILRRKAND